MCEATFTFKHLGELLQFLWTLAPQHRQAIGDLRHHTHSVRVLKHALLWLRLDDWILSRHVPDRGLQGADLRVMAWDEVGGWRWQYTEVGERLDG